MKTVELLKNNIHKGSLILINREYPLIDCGEETPLILIGNDEPWVHLEATTAAVFTHLMGLLPFREDIIPVSGYRPLEEQQRIYEESLEQNGREFTEKYVALPNHSEHQTGLAIDLALKRENIDFIRPYFPYDGVCKIFREKAIQYGFIERYQRGKEAITGIAHEPWHFRYVGYPHSLIMRDRNFTLEEYIDFLKLFPYDGMHFITTVNKQSVEIFYVHESSYGEIKLPEDSIYQISGNNVNGFIITLWR